MPTEYWIQHLKLNPHPEGGFFKETYRANESIDKRALPSRFKGERNYSTAIYFLLRSQDRSVFHRIKSDELWHFYAGSTLEIFVLANGSVTIHRLGMDIENGESLQVVIPAGSWFGAKLKQPSSYTLAGCTVAPGFDFEDFEIANRDELLKSFPGAESLILLLT